jgi:choline dehydrogenase
VQIRSGEPDAAPRIFPNYLSTENDMRVFVDSLKLAQRIAQTRPLADVIDSRLYLPEGPLDDAKWENWARATGRTTYHATSTCAMGTDQENSVVDPSLKVHGMMGLRVIDASIMPLVVSGNTAAAATMIGEKGAALVLADYK